MASHLTSGVFLGTSIQITSRHPNIDWSSFESSLNQARESPNAPTDQPQVYAVTRTPCSPSPVGPSTSTPAASSLDALPAPSNAKTNNSPSTSESTLPLSHPDPQRTCCPACRYPITCITVTKAGMIQPHGQVSFRCSGSGKPLSPQLGSCHYSEPCGPSPLQSTLSTFQGPSPNQACPAHGSPPATLSNCPPATHNLPEISTILHINIPTLQHVPKGARSLMGQGTL